MLDYKDEVDLSFILQKIKWPGYTLYDLDEDLFKTECCGTLLAKIDCGKKRYVVVNWNDTDDICVMEYSNDWLAYEIFELLKINKVYKFEIDTISDDDYRLIGGALEKGINLSFDFL